MIPDFKVGMVPHVGIVVGSRATLVIDPGMGLKNGQVVLREVAEGKPGPRPLHCQHAFSSRAHDRRSRVPAEHPGHTRRRPAAGRRRDGHAVGGALRQRSPEIADLLKEGHIPLPAEIFEKEKVLDLGGVRVRLIWLGPGHTRGDTVAFVEGDHVLFSGDLAMKNLFPRIRHAAIGQPPPGSRASTRWRRCRDAASCGPLRAHRQLRHRRVSALPHALQARVAALKQQGTSAAQPRSCSWTSSSSSTPPGSSRVASRPPSRRYTRSCPETQDAPNRAWT